MEKISIKGDGDIESPPASAWVRFLRSYGPTQNNMTMFDEYVSAALGRAKVRPINLPTPLLTSMIQHIESKAAGSLLITGTAGDGKTYHCRALWNHIKGDPKVWEDKGNVKEHRLADGRLAVFIKDLSEFNGDESDQPLQRFENSVLCGDDSEVVVLAANHGQILDRLRNLGKRQGRVHPLLKPLQEHFLQAGPQQPKRLVVFDLSRTTSRKILDDLIEQLANHPEWDKCKRCPLNSGGKICPGAFQSRKVRHESCFVAVEFPRWRTRTGPKGDESRLILPLAREKMAEVMRRGAEKGGRGASVLLAGSQGRPLAE